MTFEEISRANGRTRWLDSAIKMSVVGLVLALIALAALVVTFEIRERSSSLSARAVANLSEAVRQDPNNARVRILLADAFSADGRLRDAYEQYQAALTLSPDDPGALAGLANLAMAQDDWRTAESYWLKIIEVLSVNPMAAQDARLEKAYFYLGTTYMELKEYEDAARTLKEALRLKRDASDTHFLLAVAYREMGLDVKFREELEITLMFDPRMPDATYEYALLLLADGDTAGAAEYFRLSADGAPSGVKEPFEELAKLGSPEDHLSKAQQAEEAGDFAAALSEARISAALDPAETEAIRIAARMFEKTGEPQSAKGAWEKLTEIEPKDEEAIAAIARLQKEAE